jgi:hypothetical protein
MADQLVVGRRKADACGLALAPPGGAPSALGRDDDLETADPEELLEVWTDSDLRAGRNYCEVNSPDGGRVPLGPGAGPGPRP